MRLQPGANGPSKTLQIEDAIQVTVAADIEHGHLANAGKFGFVLTGLTSKKNIEHGSTGHFTVLTSKNVSSISSQTNWVPFERVYVTLANAGQGGPAAF